MTTMQETIQRTDSEQQWRKDVLQLLREIRRSVKVIEHAMTAGQLPDSGEHVVTLTIDPTALGMPACPGAPDLPPK